MSYEESKIPSEGSPSHKVPISSTGAVLQVGCNVGEAPPSDRESIVKVVVREMGRDARISPGDINFKRNGTEEANLPRRAEAEGWSSGTESQQASSNPAERVSTSVPRPDKE